MMMSSFSGHTESDYNAFLFAPIVDETTGLKLSVLSALARQDIDPWLEAAMLTRLPSATARTRLARIIVAEIEHVEDADTFAAHLIALLPRTTTSIAAASGDIYPPPDPGGYSYSNAWSGRHIIVLILVLTGLTISLKCLMANLTPVLRSAITIQIRNAAAPK